MKIIALVAIVSKQKLGHGGHHNMTKFIFLHTLNYLPKDNFLPICEREGGSMYLKIPISYTLLISIPPLYNHQDEEDEEDEE